MSALPFETVLPGGFLRVTSLAERSAWLPRHLRRRIRSAEAGDSAALRRALRALDRPLSVIASLTDRSGGGPARVAGRVVALDTSPVPGGGRRAAWWVVELHEDEGQGGGLAIESGFDFLLDDGTGEPLQVLAAGGRLVSPASAAGRVSRLPAPLDAIDHPAFHEVLRGGGVGLSVAALSAGSEVEVIGEVDVVVDPTSRAGGHRGPPVRAVARTGDGLPLLVRLR